MPNQVPIPAVNAIAIAPQKLTRKAPFQILAPPVHAANIPRRTRNIKEVKETQRIKLLAGDTKIINKGKAAPTAKDAADDSAA